MSVGISKNTRIYSGEKARTFSFRLTSSTPTPILSGMEAYRGLVGVRLVNTDAGATFEPMLWLVPNGQTPGEQYQIYPTGMSVRAQKAFVENGTPASPVITVGYGDILYGAALSGEGNLFYTIVQDLN